ncbi:MAG: ParB N-terminal domain-containing protein [Methylococcaceae bacterium]
MSLKKRGLGRGLEALLDNVSTKDEKHQLQSIPVDIFQGSGQIKPEDINLDGLLELANVITESRTSNYNVIKKIGDDSFEIVAGESRWRASLLTELEEMPVITKEMKDREALTIALIETIQKENLNLLQEAEGLRNLIAEFEAMVSRL